MPLPRRPHRASPDEIKITRNGDEVIIAYADSAVATTHFKLGQEKVATMTEEELLAVWNDHLEARDELMKEHEHVAVEIPAGDRSSGTSRPATSGCLAETCFAAASWALWTTPTSRS